jgi:hypothetical protein
MRQCAPQCVALCGSAVVRECGSTAVYDGAAVCDSVSGNVWQYARGNVQQCGSV